MKAIIKFHSENISFIPLKEEHIALINALHSFPEVARNNTIGLPKDLATTAEILADKLSPHHEAALGWALYNKENAFIGEAGISKAPQRFQKAEISYSLLPNQCNTGSGDRTGKTTYQTLF